MKLLFRTAFFLFIFILASCKKDKKVTTPPTITYNAPSTGQAYGYVYDAIAHKYHLPINVIARVTDAVRLSSVNVSLTDMNHTPLQGPVSVPIISADFNFNIIYDVTDFRLQTGTYLIQITADDGTSASSSFQPIYVIEAPTLWLGYCYNLKGNPQLITGIDSLKNGNLSIPLTGTYNGMKYGSYNQQLYVNGNGNMPFTAYNIQNGASVYQVTATPGQINYTSLNTDGYKPYIGFRNGNLYAYSNTGAENTSYRYTGANPSYPYYFATTSTNNVAVYTNIAASPPNNDVLVTFSSAGAAYNSTNLSVYSSLSKIIGVFEKSLDSLYVLGNDTNNQAIAYVYTSEGGFSTSPISGFGSFGKMLSATKINNESVVFSTNNGVYVCNGLHVNMTSLLPSAQKIIYQSKLNVLVAANSTANAGTLSAYTLSATSGIFSLTPIAKMSLTLADSVFDFELITNK